LLFILTEYFYPFLDGGGPLRSIDGLISCFGSHFETKLITSSKSYKGESLPLNYKSDTFSKNINTVFPIAYISKTLKGLIFLFSIIHKNDTVYINGLFMPSLNLIPIIITNNVIISPRGMLQDKLLKQKKIQKRIYLTILKTIFFFKKIKWHATNKQEVLEIQNQFGNNADITIISNVPVQPFKKINSNLKDVRNLRLVYLGLIVENKGLLDLIKTLKELNLPILLDIYGPVKDQKYADSCFKEIENNVSNAIINYKGAINPSESQSVLQNYHAFVLLTKGENFGHAIYESLSVGTPVVISNKTPWKFSSINNPAGWLVNIEDESVEDCSDLYEVLKKLYYMDNEEYQLSSKEAHNYAIEFYESQDLKKQYEELFNLNSN